MNDHIPDEVKGCDGRKRDDPVHPLWHPECMSCVRRWTELKSREKISPWDGHGPCPDKLEMEK